MTADNSTSTQQENGRWHTLQQGDCISSIADQYRHFWQTIWNHPNNQSLRELREDPDQLMPGDEIWVPDLRAGEESAAVDQRHQFRRRGVPAKLRLRFLIKGVPRENDPYRIVIDGGEIVRGNLDGDGMMDVSIPPSAQRAQVFIGEGANEARYEFQLGHIDPLNEISGIQRRLENLGYACPTTGELDDRTRGAILAFQKGKGLEETGEPDDATQSAIRDAHGS
jgi:hypothetical protein